MQYLQTTTLTSMFPGLKTTITKVLSNFSKAVPLSQRKDKLVLKSVWLSRLHPKTLPTSQQIVARIIYHPTGPGTNEASTANIQTSLNMVADLELSDLFRHKDKVELDGKIVKEEKEAVKRIKGEALKEKDDPEAFIFLIRLEGQVNKNALADTGSDINTMPYQIYEQLRREEMKKVDRGITMINHTQAEAMGTPTNVLCQVGVTTLIAMFLILDILIDSDALIVVGQGFLRMIGGIVNTPEILFSTFDGFCHQTFRAARSDVMRNAESDSDDDEEYRIKRTKFGAPIYGPNPALYLNCNDPTERSLAI
ncbi:DNA-directed DNA polymerase [Tanacetum coccineum]